MILIVGCSHDDVLYYHSIIKFPKEVKIFKSHTAVVGTIFNREVMILENIYTSYLSSATVAYIIEKFFISLVFSVGKCQAISHNLKEGDIAVSQNVVLGDVDQISQVKGTKLGQIPEFPEIYSSNGQVFSTLNASLDRIANGSHFDCLYFASNAYAKDDNLVKRITKDESVLGIRDNIVTDSESGGIALACYLFDVPFIAVKVVEGKAGTKIEIDDYIKVLKQYAAVGKAVISCIGEISRQDVLR